VDGRVNGRELFVTTRKPAAKRKPRTKKTGDELNETPKRGRPRKREESNTPRATPQSPTKKGPAKQDMSTEPKETEMEEMEVVDLVDVLEDGLPEMDDDTQAYTEEDTQVYSDIDAYGLHEEGHEFETPTHDNREDSVLPVEPYRSFHSSPPSSPVYEEYQVPIPTSSSPAKPSSRSILPSPFAPRSLRDPVHTPTPQEKFRRRARSRSASRERRMSIAPTPLSQGLPSTPRRSVSEISDSIDEDRFSYSTRSTEVRSVSETPQQPTTDTEIRTQKMHIEGMTPVRNWAAELAEGAFRFDKSPSKLVQFPIQNEFTTTASHPVMIEDEEEDQMLEDEHIIEISDLEDDLPESTPSPAKLHPQISRLQVSHESPIVITSSPPSLPTEVHYQWKTKTDPVEDLEEDVKSDYNISMDDSSMSRCNLSSWSRQSSPARSILGNMGEDVIDISSTNPLVAKRAADLLLKSNFYSKITFDDDEGRKIWENATEQAGDYELSQIDIPSDDGSEDVEAESESEDEEMQIDSPSPVKEPPPRISQGEWTKLDWKRLEKCLHLRDGDMNDAIDLFQERYTGREREEVEMRCKAVMLANRRRVLEGRKVEFILSTLE
jgi:hypothetical protein